MGATKCLTKKSAVGAKILSGCKHFILSFLLLTALSRAAQRHASIMALARQARALWEAHYKKLKKKARSVRSQLFIMCFPQSQC